MKDLQDFGSQKFGDGVRTRKKARVVENMESMQGIERGAHGQAGLPFSYTDGFARHSESGILLN